MAEACSVGALLAPTVSFSNPVELLEQPDQLAAAIIAVGTADEVRDTMGRGQHSLTATFVESAGRAADFLREHGGVHDVSVDGQVVTCGFSGSDEDQAELLADIIAEGYPVKCFEEQNSSFEEILIEVAEKNRES